jgi:hypothetical protein
MKSKLALLILCFSVIFFGCKKEKGPEDPLPGTQKQIVGTWKVLSGTETFYDSSGKAVGSHDTGLSTDLKFIIDATTLKTSDSPGSSYNYTLANTDNKVTITVDGESYQVAINNDTMTWSKEQQYQQQDYARSILVIQFKRQ